MAAPSEHAPSTTASDPTAPCALLLVVNAAWDKDRVDASVRAWCAGLASVHAPRAVVELWNLPSAAAPQATLAAAPRAEPWFWVHAANGEGHAVDERGSEEVVDDDAVQLLAWVATAACPGGGARFATAAVQTPGSGGPAFLPPSPAAASPPAPPGLQQATVVAVASESGGTPEGATVSAVGVVEPLIAHVEVEVGAKARQVFSK
jgi:hypothetical protein